MGRKPISDEAKTDSPLRIRLTRHERAMLDDAAKIADIPTSTWARNILLTQVTRRRARRHRSA